MQGQPIIAVLVVLNLALQVFDGGATYVGYDRFGEANPILRAGFESWGLAPTLLSAKLFACATLLWLAYVPRRMLVMLGLALTLGAYTALSLIPWSIRLLAI